AGGPADRALAGGRGRASRSAGPHHPGGRGSGGRGARDGAPARSHAGRDPLSSPRGGRWRSGAAIAVVASSVLVLVTVGWAGHRAERALAQRVAAATAGYLALVAPPARGSAGYDLPRLLIETRALGGLPAVATGGHVVRGSGDGVRVGGLRRHPGGGAGCDRPLARGHPVAVTGGGGTGSRAAVVALGPRPNRARHRIDAGRQRGERSLAAGGRGVVAGGGRGAPRPGPVGRAALGAGRGGGLDGRLVGADPRPGPHRAALRRARRVG